MSHSNKPEVTQKHADEMPSSTPQKSTASAKGTASSKASAIVKKVGKATGSLAKKAIHLMGVALAKAGAYIKHVAPIIGVAVARATARAGKFLLEKGVALAKIIGAALVIAAKKTAVFARFAGVKIVDLIKALGRLYRRKGFVEYRREVARLAGALVAVTVLAGALLGWVNGVTAEKIASASAQRVTDALEQLIPEANFTEISLPASADPAIRAAWAADINCASAGMCVEVAAIGFGGEITIIVGIGEDGKIAGVQITKHSETAGFGTKAAQPGWLAQFEGLTGPLSLVKNIKNAENDIVAVTAATMTSSAVTKGVQAALSFARDYMGVE